MNYGYLLNNNDILQSICNILKSQNYILVRVKTNNVFKIIKGQNSYHLISLADKALLHSNSIIECDILSDKNIIKITINGSKEPFVLKVYSEINIRDIIQ